MSRHGPLFAHTCSYHPGEEQMRGYFFWLIFIMALAIAVPRAHAFQYEYLPGDILAVPAKKARK